MKFIDLAGVGAFTEHATTQQLEALMPGERVVTCPLPGAHAPRSDLGMSSPHDDPRAWTNQPDSFVFREDVDWLKCLGGSAAPGAPTVVAQRDALQDMLRANGIANDAMIDLGNGKVMVLEDIILAPVPFDDT